jgi:hypothetical protein
MMVSVSRRALVRELDGEAVLLDLDSGMYYGLNATATWIWNRAKGSDGVQVDTLVAELAEEFDVGLPVAEREAAAFIEALRINRLASVRP